jgi:metal iron transporter
MNCPSRTDEPEGTGFNQNPSALAADLTTRQDLNGIANSRILRRMQDAEIENLELDDPDGSTSKGGKGKETAVETMKNSHVKYSHVGYSHVGSPATAVLDFDGVHEDYGVGSGSGGNRGTNVSAKCLMRLRKVMVTFGKFVGPGFMVCRLLLTPPGHI